MDTQTWLTDTTVLRIQRAARASSIAFLDDFRRVTTARIGNDREIHIDFCAGDLVAVFS